MIADLLGMRVIESKFLPEHVVMLDNGDTLYAWNTATGEVRSMPKSDLLKQITNLWPVSPGSVPTDHDPNHEAKEE